MLWRNLLVAMCLLAINLAWPAFAPAQQLAADPVLSIVTLDEDENVIATRTLSMADLRALPAAEFATTTIWTEGMHTFRGVWLGDLMAHLGITQERVEFSALNEYVVEIPMQDMVPGGPLLAYEQNGKQMSAREKGPLWVVFPYDSAQKYQTESVYAQSIWQMDRINVYR
ncbi:molybdopterin-dependent oxidoreductase [Thalassovita sp.]|uniref:molybdopterin-dependent oxidoreductase n=1 Tax=Thalassovita sp. TaxID=1979401 RepID=UPI0029DE6E69|nr:molybdopterin-dependent oxidoreductase [Thalassovita sp.]